MLWLSAGSSLELRVWLRMSLLNLDALNIAVPPVLLQRCRQDNACCSWQQSVFSWVKLSCCLSQIFQNSCRKVGILVVLGMIELFYSRTWSDLMGRRCDFPAVLFMEPDAIHVSVLLVWLPFSGHKRQLAPSCYYCHVALNLLNIPFSVKAN